MEIDEMKIPIPSILKPKAMWNGPKTFILFAYAAICPHYYSHGF